MSTLQVDRIIPYQSSSVTVEGLSAPNLATTGSNTFVGNQNIQGTITASIQEGFALVGGVGDVSTLVATSSFGSSGNFATTGSNTFNGDQLINGIATSTFTAPASETQKDIAVVNGANIDGTAYTNVFFGMQDYPGSGEQFKDAFVFDYWTDFNYATGSDFIVSPKRIGGSMLLSGSAGGVSRTGISQLRDLAGKTFLNQYANLINIGSFAPATTDQIFIGHNQLPVLRISSLKNEITGSTIISGSNDFDLVVQGKQSIIGPTTGQVPQLIISSSDFSNTIGRGIISIVGSGSFAPTISISGSSHRNTIGQRTLEIGKSGFDYPVFTYQYTEASSSILLNFTENLSATASYTVGVFDNGFTQDVELVLETTTTNGVQFKDIRSDNGAYTTFLKIAPNGGSNPPLEFKRSAEVTGSVSISDVLQLAQKDPLPAGAVGQLAVSGSNLYYNNGATWTQIN
jgi:hypothetical protein